MKKILVIILLFPVLLMGQSKSENFVKTRTYTVKSTGPVTNKDTLVNVTYLDGLGRPKQTIAVNAGGAGQNIVTPVQYDAYGRQTKQYLPYANPAETGTTGTLNYTNNTTLLSTQASYYVTQFPNDASGPNSPNSEVIIENSPLERPTQQTFPGNDWAQGGKTVKYEYGTNSLSIDPVYDFRVSFTNNETDNPNIYLQGGTFPQQYYAAGTLYKTVIKDENWISTDGNNKTVHQYKDKQGRLILERKFENAIAHDTYYVYDMFGNLTYVISPQAFTVTNFITSTVVNSVTTFKITSSPISRFAYTYKYDSRNRVIEKKVPGKDVEYIVYDKLDRPVLTQNGNQRDAAGGGLRWLFTKYDKFNRIVYTGEYTSTATRASLQTTVDSATILSETKTALATYFTLNGLQVNYNNAAFPTTGIELFAVNYYDDYNFSKPNITVPTASDYSETLTTSLKTLPTGIVTRIPDPTVATTSQWVTTVTGYDAKGRMIWAKDNNPYYTVNSTTNIKLDFAGKPTETKLAHVRGGTSPLTVTVNDYYTYGYAGRMATHTQKIDSNPIETIASNTYNERGQLIQKRIGGGAQVIDYKYNIRGWLTNINDPNTLGTDVFAESIAYNQPGTGGVALYNGNISKVSWKTLSDSQLRNYNYTYDALNRIKTAIFTNTTNTAQNGSYNLNSIAYDRNGNITSLQRNGAIGQTNIDNMTYSYTGNALQGIKEDGSITLGFKALIQGNTAVQYTYDDNGNLKTDTNKGITAIDYNYLNLPLKVTFGTGRYIQYIYDAAGTKVKKVYYNGTTTTTTEYINGLVYQKSGTGTSAIQYIPNEEGYVYKNSGNAYSYAYQMKDHLGNVRVSFADVNKDLSVVASERIEENNYDPFGLKHTGYNTTVTANGNSVAQKLEYNGQEFEEAEGYAMNEMDWRHYDPAIGRFNCIDKLAEITFKMSPYIFSNNNPVIFVDPRGLAATYNWDTGKYMDGGKEVSFDEAMKSNGVKFYSINSSTADYIYNAMSDSSQAGGGAGSSGDGWNPLRSFWNWLTGKKYQRTVIVGDMGSAIFPKISETATTQNGDESTISSNLGDAVTLKLYNSTSVGEKSQINVDFSSFNGEEPVATYQISHTFGEFSVTNNSMQMMINIKNYSIGTSIGKDGFGAHWTKTTYQDGNTSSGNGGDIIFKPGGYTFLAIITRGLGPMFAPIQYIPIP